MLKDISEKMRTDFGGFAQIFLLLALSGAGLFHPFLCAFAAAVLLGYLCFVALKNNKFIFRFNLSSAAVGAVSLFYMLSVFWAVDSGEAFLGIFKFIIPFLWMLILMQQEAETKQKCLHILPLFASFMTVISTILSFIPQTEALVEIAGRLCGFFQYSNTFALFLLVSLIICVTKEKLAKTDIAIIPILIFGIFYSGSRTVFILTALSVLALLIFAKNKKLKIITGAAVLTIGVVVMIVALATDNFYSIGRFLTFSFTESTFVGRLLYYTDALPVILRHPFGLGFMGYYYMQSSFATGVYSVAFVHNDFMQMLLDIGFVPTLLFIAAIVKSFFNKTADIRKRLMLLVICIHSFFDFDLQYIAIFMFLVLLLDFDEGKEAICKNKVVIPVLSVPAAVLSLYIAVASLFSFVGQTETAQKMYPFKTADNIVMLTKAEDAHKIKSIAEKILSQNEYVSIAHSALARVAFSEGKILAMIEHKDKAIETAVFSYEEYLDYANMLIYAIDLYGKSGNEQSAVFCAQKLIAIRNNLAANSDRLSRFGKLINDQPTVEFPTEINDYIDNLQEFLKQQTDR